MASMSFVPSVTKRMHNYNICDITPFTLQDFPDTIACIIWFSGCNMLCSYCHNLDLVYESEKNLSMDEVLNFLKTREKKLEGVVFCGGEPTLYPNILELSQRIKSMGFKIKLDTNGSKPEVIHKLLQYLDFVALDFKSTELKFLEITHSKLYSKFEESLDLLLSSSVDFEVRTTYHSELLSYENINEMIDFLEKKEYKNRYFIQPYMAQQRFIKELPKSLGFDTSKIKLSTLNIAIR
ncbi:MAG: anaerobic ribonucleoside-triphosphate reductase activating protein [Sulfurimonas sp.]